MNGLASRLIVLALFYILSTGASAMNNTWVLSLKSVAMALGWLMMIVNGIKWTIADSPNDRGEAKKGMMYIMVGLLVVNAACGLLCLFCDTICYSLPAVGGIHCEAGGAAAPLLVGLGCDPCNPC